MANTTSGTATFDKNFSIDEIVEEAYERIGQQTFQVISLNLQDDLLIFYFKNGQIEVYIIGRLQITILLIADQAVYTMLDLQEMVHQMQQQFMVSMMY